MSIPDSVAKTGAPPMAAWDGSGRWRCHFSAEAEMALILKCTHTHVYAYTYTSYTRIYKYTGVRKVQTRMVLVGAGRWRPLMDSLWRPPRMPHHAGKKSKKGGNPKDSKEIQKIKEEIQKNQQEIQKNREEITLRIRKIL